MAGTASIMAGMAFVKITMDNAELKRGLDEAQGKVQKFAASVNSFSSKMVMMGPLIAAPFVAATRAFAAFDDQMRLTGAVTGAIGKDFEKLTEQAKRLGRETSFTAAQVAGGMASLGRMGFRPQEIENAIKPMMNLARATGTDLAEASAIAANAMRAMGVDTSKAADVTDILVTTANSSAQTLTDLGEALKMAAPAAHTAGENITDVNAALGVLANVGIKGSMAGNALKRAYSELAKMPTQEYLHRFGIDVVDSTGNLRRMADVLRDCAAAMAQMGSAEKMNFATQVFGERAAPAVLAMTADTSKIDEMLQKLENCKDAAARTADEMDKGLGGALRKLASAAEGVNIAIGEIIATSFSPVIDSVSAFCLTIRDAIGEAKELVSGIMSIVGGALAAGAAVKTFAIAASFIKSAFSPLIALNALYLNCVDKAVKASVAAEFFAAAQKNAAVPSRTLGSVLGKLSSAKLFSAACSTKHANAVLSASMSEMVAAKTASGASMLRKAGYYAEAAAAKVAAGATLGLKAALDFLMANPITIAVLAVGAAFWALSNAVSSTAEEFRKESDAAKDASESAEKALQKGDTKRQNAEVNFKRLRQLEEISRRGKLSAEEMAEAEKLINRLNPYGSSQWTKLDKVAKDLTLVADAQNKLNASMKQAAYMDLQAEISNLQAEKKALQAENDNLLGYWNHTNLAAITGRSREAAKQTEINGDRIAAVMQKIYAAEARLNALRADDMKAVTGEQDKSSTTDRIRATEESRRAAAKELADAEKELARIDEENAKKKMSQFENEIAEIEKMKKKYLELAELKKKDLLAELNKQRSIASQNNIMDATPVQEAAFKAALAAGKQAKKELDELNQRIEQATADFDEQKKQAEEKESERKKQAEERKKQAEERKKQAEAKYTGFLQNAAQKQQQHDAEKAQDKQFDDLQKDKSPEGVRALAAFMDALSGNLEAAKAEYQRQLDQFRSADSEGGSELSEAERAQLDAMQQAINASISKLNSYRDRIEGGIQTAQQKTQTLASFDASTLQNLFDRSGRAAETREERIAKATEETAKNTKKLTHGGGLLVG